MSNPNIPPLPGTTPDEDAEIGTMDTNGERVLDPDANAELIQSADADRLAAEAGPDDLPADERRGS
ncbi:hypothetical protein ACQUSY_12050 [Microbacterium sp. YY-03]|uniref:hypothetical protein n=1 Tax=Microbacterium sp. YY-03 TaxID=3421636 RepID=UPI003D169E0B